MWKFPSLNHHPVNREGLIAWYASRNTGNVAALGTAKDYSGNGYDLTGFADAYVDNTGFVFDGTGDAFHNATNAVFSGRGAISVLTWIKADTLAATDVFVGSHDGVNGVELELNGVGEVLFGIGNGVAFVTLTTTDFGLSTGVWYNIAATYDGTTMKVYKNAVISTDTEAQTGNIGTTTNGIAIGADNGLGNGIEGIVNDVQIYNRALSLGEIQANYLKNKRG